MNCQQISDILDELKADKNGRIRGKNRVIDKLHALYLNDEKIISTKQPVSRSHGPDCNDLWKCCPDCYSKFVMWMQNNRP
mgnify:CR=1 FL=1